MRRQRVVRALVVAAVLMLHATGWWLVSRPPVAARRDKSPQVLATLRLLPWARPVDARTAPSARRTESPRTPSRAAAPRPAGDAIRLPSNDQAASVDLEVRTAPEAASAPLPLDLTLKPGRQPTGIASQARLAPTAQGDGSVAVPGVGRELDMGDGRRRIFTADGKCFDTYPSRSSQLDPFQPGMLRDLKMVKPCD